MDEYFVTAQPKPSPPPPPALTREDVEKIDLSVYHEPYRVPRSVLALGLLGKAVLVVLMTAAAAVPIFLLVAAFKFLESLPF